MIHLYTVRILSNKILLIARDQTNGWIRCIWEETKVTWLVITYIFSVAFLLDQKFCLNGQTKLFVIPKAFPKSSSIKGFTCLSSNLSFLAGKMVKYFLDESLWHVTCNYDDGLMTIEEAKSFSYENKSVVRGSTEICNKHFVWEKNWYALELWGEKYWHWLPLSSIKTSFAQGQI